MNEEKKIIELLPGGKFFINRKDGKAVKGRFSMYMLDRFCLQNGIDNYLTLFDKLSKGMRPGEYVDMILMAIHDYFRDNEDTCEWNKKTLSDLLDDELDGMTSDEFDQLMRHAIGRVVNIKPFIEAANKLTAEEEEEKKKTLKDISNGTISGSNATPQD
jgi:hypothetical protein